MAVCEQLADPAEVKGLVPRDVVQSLLGFEGPIGSVHKFELTLLRVEPATAERTSRYRLRYEGTTAGTITTVTNVTNAPTVGDFTTAMKTSLNDATPASVTDEKPRVMELNPARDVRHQTAQRVVQALQSLWAEPTRAQ